MTNLLKCLISGGLFLQNEPFGGLASIQRSYCNISALFVFTDITHIIFLCNTLANCSDLYLIVTKLF